VICSWVISPVSSTPAACRAKVGIELQLPCSYPDVLHVIAIQLFMADTGFGVVAVTGCAWFPAPRKH
jgi:hypothetical protein